MPFRVGVEKMVGAGIILVDALLNQPHPEDAGVEIEIFLSRPGDRSDVMKSGDRVACDSSKYGKAGRLPCENHVFST